MHFLSTLRSSFLIGKQLIKHSCLQTTKRSFRPKNSTTTSNGMKLAPKVNYNVTEGNSLVPGLLKCYIFTAGFCGVVFVGASIWEQENIKKQFQGDIFSFWTKKDWNNAEGFEHKEFNFRKSVNKWWNQQTEGRKIFWGILAVNLLVFAGWRHPGLRGTMLQYFCSSPAAKAICWPMFLCTFSHHAAIHLGMNMYVLYTFSNAICSTLGPEQFVALYLTGGVVSSLASQTFKVALLTAGPSLGASGAIMALIGFFCTQYPDAKLGIIFLPQFPFSAGIAIKVVMCVETLGILFRWKLFDHAAHLGGALFGILYAKYGQSHIWPNKNGTVIKTWENLNKKYGITEKKD